MVGPAFQMRVSPAFPYNAQNNSLGAMTKVNVFSHSMLAPPKAQAVPVMARDGRTVVAEGSHKLMTEAPDAVLCARKDVPES
jgi:hypothetical protein